MNKSETKNLYASSGTLFDSVRGHWQKIFLESNLVPEDFREGVARAINNPGKHAPCPKSGGVDGFRFFADVSLSGGGVANSYKSMANGFQVLAWLRYGNADGPSIKKVYSEVAQYMKHGFSTSELSEDVSATWKASVLAAQAEEKAKRERTRARSRKLWQSARPAPQLLLSYLQGRGIDEPETPSGIRLVQNLPYFQEDAESDEQGSFTSGVSYHPAFLLPVLLGNEVVALHRVYLSIDIDLGVVRKAPVPKPKKSMKWKNMSGAAVRLFDLAADDDTLVVSEGFENGVVARILSGLPVWSCLTAVGLEYVQIPAQVKRLIIAEDHDRNGRGKTAGQVLKLRAQQAGIEVHTMSPEQFPILAGETGVDWKGAYASHRAEVERLWQPFMPAAMPTADKR